MLFIIYKKELHEKQMKSEVASDRIKAVSCPEYVNTTLPASQRC